MIVLARAVLWFGQFLTFAMMFRAIFSWFARDPYSPVGRIYRFTIALTEPIVRPCRNFMSRFNTGMFDFSIVIAMILVEIVTNLIVKLLLII